MTHHPKSVIIVGLIIPVIITVVILISSVIGFSYFQRTLKKKITIYNGINSCQQQLRSAHEESQFLDTEMTSLKEIRQFNKFISNLQNATKTEKGVKLTRADTPASDQRALVLEGLSGPTVSSIGEAFRKCPTVLIDSWNIQKKKNGKALVFNIKVTLSITEHNP